MKIRNFISRFVFSLGLVSMLAGCGENNGGEAPDPTPQPADYSSVKTSVEKWIGDNDYCKSLAVTNSEIKMTSNSGDAVSVPRGDVPYLMVSKLRDTWTVNGKNTTLKIPADIRTSAPEISVKDGKLIVAGQDMGVDAGTGLRCMINADKYIYLCFEGKTFAWGSEVYGRFNPPLPVGDSQLNILFIGNSFTQDATEHLPGMLVASGISNVYLTRLFHGGYTLPEYLANFEKPNICARRNASSGMKTWDGDEKEDDSPIDALKAREWDIVVIQEHTGRKEGWEWPGTLEAALNGLIDKIFASQPNHRPTIVYLMSQTYSNGSNVLKNSFADNREKMFATTTFVAKKVLEETCVDIVISTGAMLENLRTSSLNNEMQLTRDSYHMDYGIARYGAACAVFETLITPCTGKNVSDCPYRYSTSSTASGKYSTPVTDANAPIAQQAAHAAILSPFEVTPVAK